MVIMIFSVSSTNGKTALSLIPGSETVCGCGTDILRWVMPPQTRPAAAAAAAVEKKVSRIKPEMVDMSLG